MSYFAHGFNKPFIGTKLPAVIAGTVDQTAVNNGMVNEAGIATLALKNLLTPNTLGLGTYGFFTKDTYLSVLAGSAEVLNGEPLILASAAIPLNDKIGPFHGGYAESNKSKYINPKLISNFYKVEDAIPEQSIVHVGVTNFQVGTTITLLAAGTVYPTDGTFTNLATTVAPAGGTGMTVDIVVLGGVVVSIVENQVGTGYAIADVITVADDAVTGIPATPATATVNTVGNQDCEFEFLCGETYNLQINLYGSPVLRVMNRDSYRTLAAYTGCCPEGTITPTAVDSTLVMIDWANQIIESPYLMDFIRPIVYDESGVRMFATAQDAIDAGFPGGVLWTDYVSTGHIDGALAGIRIIGAFISTEFQNCSFQVSDYFGKEVVQMNLSLVDETGDPCTFNGICISTECCGFGGQGFGDTYLKEVLMGESYLQNFMSTDPRIREITQGNELRDALVRNQFYTKYVIQHSVPRPYNPSGIYDADQYNLCIYLPTGATAVAMEALMTAWLSAANNPITLTEFGHTACVPTAI
tara:strand:+ start:5370 stop:6944 length:1575 start_codon:yes stop_codon:yes gene_type:complete